MKYQKHEAKAWARKNLPGINGGIIQPLNKDYSIDYEGTKAWINRQIEMGVDSITCDGACGEWMTFTVEERKKIYEVAVEAVAGRVPLLANTSHPSIMAAVELAKHAQDVGVDALMHVTPYSNSSSNEGVLRYYQYLADRVDIAICLYNTKPSGYVLTPEFIKELAEKIPNVCGIKQGMGSIDQTLKAYKAAGHLIVVGDPFEDYWPEQLRYMPETAMNFCSFLGALAQTPAKPRFIQYTKLIKEGKIAEGMKIYNEMSPLRVLFHETQGAYLMGKGVFPLAGLKYWAEKIGLPGGPVRPPFETLNEYMRGQIDTRLAEAGLV